MKELRLTWVCLIGMSCLCTGCSSAYYGAWEALGFEKRDILVERVEEARDEQEAAKQQFSDALDQFLSVVGTKHGELEGKYKALKSSLAASEKRADAVRERIASVDKVSTALFAEWEKELEQYSNADLRRRSADQMRQTRTRYDQMYRAMKQAEAKMEPVLMVLRDQVLFMKHNLNAQALASLDGIAHQLDEDVARLVRDMQDSIDEANAFIDSMGK